MVVIGYNFEGVEVYMESVLIDEGVIYELGYEGNVKKKLKLVISFFYIILFFRGGGSLYIMVIIFM